MEVAGKTVLVTGANGFVGTRTVRRLLAEGARVRAIVRRAGSMEELSRAGAEAVVGDFAEPAAASAAARGAEMIVHCAATATGELDAVRRVNRDGTRAMLDAARAEGVARFVQISTVAAYDFAADPPLVDERSALKTSGDAYGWTKAEADREVLAEMRAGLAAVILRPTAILGWHPTSTWAVKIPQRVRDGKLPLLADGGNTWSWVHVENLMDAMMLALRKDAAKGRVYDVVDGHSTWRAFTEDLRRWFGAPALPMRPREEVTPGQYWTGRFAAQRIRTELDWAPRMTYADGMAEAEAWWRGQARD